MVLEQELRLEDASAGFLVTGKVQGVGFRWWTMRNAQRLGLRGFVRNRPDGSVEVQAAGSPERLADLHNFLRKGPAGARVAQVERVDSLGSALPEGFEVR